MIQSGLNYSYIYIYIYIIIMSFSHRRSLGQSYIDFPACGGGRSDGSLSFDFSPITF